MEIRKNSLIEQLRKNVTVYSSKTRPVDSKPTPDDQYFIELYTDRRRRITSEYEPSPKHCSKLREARATLENTYKLKRADWPAYFDWLYDRVSAMPGMKISFPPISMITADGCADVYRLTLGRRKMDMVRARGMLCGAGYSDVPVEVIVSQARIAASNGGVISEGGTPRMREAIEWLLPRLGDVGYLPEGSK